jgi:hypothetical protein
MRIIVAVFACCLALAAHAATDELPPPMTAYVTGSNVLVRSGAGEKYYPTQKLKLGQPVEVYRIDPGGWCAIRPFDGSFTWVAARYLKPADNNLATVTEDDVPAYVGSSLSGARDVVHVRLRKGEVVELLEPSARDAKGRADNAWVKIAPPSGEFRWVAGEFLDATPPRDAPREDAMVRQTTAHVTAPLGEGSRSPREDSSPPQALSPEAFQRECERLELELSSTVTEDIARWSFESLRDRANWLLDRAETAVERGRARTLVNRIARFDDIKHRYDAARDRSARPQRPLPTLPPLATGGKSERTADAEDRFDGVGRLTAVDSAKVGAPRYALLDDTGEVGCYVTPAPGVNLRGYLGKQVGVTGSRGYMSEQRVNHLMARHIAVLDGGLLR